MNIVADAGLGAFIGAGSRQVPDYGIVVSLPAIPLWVPDAAKEVLNTLALNTLRLALQEVAGRVSDEAPVDSGQLAQSFGADPSTSTGGIELLGVDLTTTVSGRVFSSLPYAVVMEEGRRPGAPINRAGIDAIGLWAQRKLGLSAEEADDAKWAIANVIVAQGIEGKRYAETGMAAATPRIEQLFAVLGEEIAVALVKTGRPV